MLAEVRAEAKRVGASAGKTAAARQRRRRCRMICSLFESSPWEQSFTRQVAGAAALPCSERLLAVEDGDDGVGFRLVLYLPSPTTSRSRSRARTRPSAPRLRSLPWNCSSVASRREVAFSLGGFIDGHLVVLEHLEGFVDFIADPLIGDRVNGDVDSRRTGLVASTPLSISLGFALVGDGDTGDAEILVGDRCGSRGRGGQAALFSWVTFSVTADGVIGAGAVATALSLRGWHPCCQGRGKHAASTRGS